MAGEKTGAVDGTGAEIPCGSCAIGIDGLLLSM